MSAVSSQDPLKDINMSGIRDLFANTFKKLSRVLREHHTKCSSLSKRIRYIKRQQKASTLQLMEAYVSSPNFTIEKVLEQHFQMWNFGVRSLSFSSKTF